MQLASTLSIGERPLASKTPTKIKTRHTLDTKNLLTTPDIDAQVLDTLLKIKHALVPGGKTIHWEPDNSRVEICGSDNQQHENASLCWQALCSLQKQDNNYVHGYSYDEAVRLQKQSKQIRRLVDPVEAAFKWEGNEPRTLAHAAISDQPRGLELGCGTGANVDRVHNFFNGRTHVTGIDIDSGSIEHARKYVRDELMISDQETRFVQADLTKGDLGEALGADYGNYHVCLTQFVLEHIANDANFGPRLGDHLVRAGFKLLKEDSFKVVYASPKTGNASFETAIFPMLQAKEKEVKTQLNSRGLNAEKIWQGLVNSLPELSFAAQINIAIGEKAHSYEHHLLV